MPTGESNIAYRILTEELGLVTATAQSVRHEASKLRYSLQNYKYVFVDLVRGSASWRITNAREEKESLSADAQKVFARASTLALRLINGEQRDEAMFVCFEGLYEFLLAEEHPPERMRAIEVLAALRILFALGYLSPVGYEAFLSMSWSREQVEAYMPHIQRSIRSINEALRESHL